MCHHWKATWLGTEDTEFSLLRPVSLWQQPLNHCGPREVIGTGWVWILSVVLALGSYHIFDIFSDYHWYFCKVWQHSRGSVCTSLLIFWDKFGFLFVHFLSFIYFTFALFSCLFMCVNIKQFSVFSLCHLNLN